MEQGTALGDQAMQIFRERAGEPVAPTMPASASQTVD
jgi:hypothetical protein